VRTWIIFRVRSYPREGKRTRTWREFVGIARSRRSREELKAELVVSLSEERLEIREAPEISALVYLHRGRVFSAPLDEGTT